MQTRWQLLFVGTYTPDSEPPGRGEGIYRVWFDSSTGEMVGGGLAAPTPGPSYLSGGARSQPFLYAVNEQEEGTVTGFRVGANGTLTEVGSVPTGGGSPCSISIGHPLAVTNYANGVVSLHGTDEDGAPTGPEAELDHSGSGPVTERQEGPHAHSATWMRGRIVGNQTLSHLVVADLGTDELRVYRHSQVRDTAGTVTEEYPEGLHATITMPEGSGPRSLATPMHSLGVGSHIYVSGELDSRVHVVRWDTESGTGEHIDSVPATGAGSTGDNAPAEIVGHRRDNVYVSNRGADVISTFAIRDDGARLEHVADTDAGGPWPRNFAVVDDLQGNPDHLVVGSQNGDVLASLRIDADTGVPVDTGYRLSLPSPVCVIPAR